MRALPGLGVLSLMSWLTDVAIVDLLSRENRPVSIVDDRLTTDRDFLLPTVDSRREDIVLDPNKFLEMLSRFATEGRRRYEWVGVPGKEAFDVRNRYKPNTLTGGGFGQLACMRTKLNFILVSMTLSSISLVKITSFCIASSSQSVVATDILMNITN